MLARSLLATAVLIAVLAAPAAATTKDGPYYFSVAKLLAGEGDVTGALEAFENAIEAEPEDPYLRVEYAEFLFRIRRIDEAAEQAEVAHRLAPDSLDVLRTYGQVQFARGSSDPAAVEIARQVFEDLRRRAPDDISSMLALGQIYAGLDRYGDAAEVYEQLVDHHPDNRRLKRLLVDTLARAGREDRAEEVLREILRLDAEALDSRLRLAGLESDRGNHSAAIEILRAAGPENRNDDRLRSMLAHELYRRGLSPGVDADRRQADLAEALELVRETLRDRPELSSIAMLESRILLEQDRVDDAVERLQELHEESPDDLSLALQLAQGLERQGKVAEAAGLLRRLSDSLVEEQGSTEVRLRLAGLHARHGDWDGVAKVTGQLLDAEAADDSGLYDQVLGLHLNALSRLDRHDEALARLRREQKRRGASPGLLLQRAEILADAERHKEAARVLDRKEIREAEGIDLQVQRARLLLRLGETERAAALFEEMTEDGDTEALVRAGQAFLFEERWPDAITYLGRALDGGQLEEEAEVNVRYSLGMANERAGAVEAAAHQFREVIARQPDHAGAMNYLGYMWAEEGTNLEEALDLIERAVTLDPDNGAYIDSLGWVLFKLGRHDESQQRLERAAELLPEDPTIFEHLGDVLAARGETRQAREAYEKALEINSDENVEQVRRKLGEL
jgi:predicted Zn-dependent protease